MRAGDLRGLAVVGLVSGALALGGCGGDDGGTTSGGLDIVKASVGSAAGGGISAEIGKEQGFFSDEDISVSQMVAETPPARVAAVQSGAAQMAEVPTSTFINALEQNLGLHAIAPEYGYPPDGRSDAYENIDLMVGPDSDISGPEDLEGKKVAVPGRRDLMEILASNEISRAGGDPDAVDWVPLDFRSQVAALQAGRVDAVMVPFPFTLMVKGFGGSTLAQPGGAFFEQAPTTIWVVNDEVAADADLVERLERALYESNQYADDHQDEVYAIASRRTGLPEDVLKDAGAKTHYPTSLDPQSLQVVADKMFELGFLEEQMDVTDDVLPQVDAAQPDSGSDS